MDSINTLLAIIIGCLSIGTLVGGWMATSGRRRQQVDDILIRLSKLTDIVESTSKNQIESSVKIEMALRANEKIERNTTELDISMRKKFNQIARVINDLSDQIYKMSASSQFKMERAPKVLEFSMEES